jgi:hypothetical protein
MNLSLFDWAPDEIVLLILTWCDNVTVSRFEQTCRSARRLTVDEEALSPKTVRISYGMRECEDLERWLRSGKRARGFSSMTCAMFRTTAVHLRIFHTILPTCPNLTALGLTHGERNGLNRIFVPAFALPLRILSLEETTIEAVTPALINSIFERESFPNLRKLSLRGCKWMNRDILTRLHECQNPHCLEDLDVRGTLVDAPRLYLNIATRFAHTAKLRIILSTTWAIQDDEWSIVELIREHYPSIILCLVCDDPEKLSRHLLTDFMRYCNNSWIGLGLGTARAVLLRTLHVHLCKNFSVWDGVVGK